MVGNIFSLVGSGFDSSFNIQLCSCDLGGPVNCDFPYIQSEVLDMLESTSSIGLPKQPS